MSNPQEKIANLEATVLAMKQAAAHYVQLADTAARQLYDLKGEKQAAVRRPTNDYSFIRNWKKK